MREIYIKNNVGLLNIGRRGENIATRVHLHRVQESGQYVTVYVMRNGDTVGFNAKSGAMNPDTNVMAVLGNQGGKSGNGSTRINNLLMYVYKYGTSYGLRFDTAYV